jgi:hypothetical protein
MGEAAEASVQMVVALKGEHASLESLHHQPPSSTTDEI